MKKIENVFEELESQVVEEDTTEDPPTIGGGTGAPEKQR